MYVSRPVRAIRDDPIQGESITLVVTLADDADRDRVEERIEAVVAAAGGELAGELGFGTVGVTVPQTAVADLCSVDGIDAIETDATTLITLDGAGEDVEFPD